MGLSLVLFTFIVGFISFPLTIIAIFIYVLPNVKSGESTFTDNRDGENDAEDKHKDLRAGELEEKHQSGLEAFKSGWLIITSEYIESTDEINRNTTSIVESPENKSAYSTLYKIVNRQQQQQQDHQHIDAESNPANGDASETASLSFLQTLNSTPISPPLKPQQMGQPQAPTGTANAAAMRQSVKKHRYFAVLKNGNLFTYKDELMKEFQQVYVLDKYFVTIWPRMLTDAHLFTKYTAIGLINLESKTKKVKPNTFIYCDTNYEKEDWYFALIRATKHDSSYSALHASPSTPSLSSSSTTTTTTAAAAAAAAPANAQPSSSDAESLADTAHLSTSEYAQTLHFSTKEMISLIQQLYSSEGHLQTKWLNALIGRWFLAIKDTKYFENYIYTKLSKKLNKIKKPGFFDTFQITEIYPGTSAPFFTYPQLREINPDGTLVVSANISYSGGMSVTIKTKLDLAFGTKITTREADLTLKITFTNLEGPLLIKMKPPPSNRFWYCYEVEPLMQLKIEPVLSNKALSYSFITSSIEKKFKEAIKESLVLPHWDDMVFFDTQDELYRGGIWKHNRGGDLSENKLGKTDPSVDLGSVLGTDGEDDLEAKIRLSNRSLKNSKIGTTITDLTRKMKLRKTALSLEDFPSTTTTTTTTSKTTSNTPTTPNLSSTGPVKARDATESPSVMSNTLKKIGKWYFKDDIKQLSHLAQQDTKFPRDPANKLKPSSSSSAVSVTGSSSASEPYHPPEMISNRRPNRKSSNASASGIGTNTTINTSNTNSNDGGKSSERILTDGVPSTISEHAIPSLQPPALPERPPSFNFARFDNDSNISNFELPRGTKSSSSRTPQRKPSNINPSTTTYPNSSTGAHARANASASTPISTSAAPYSLSHTHTAGSLSASGFLSTISQLPDSPTLKQDDIFNDTNLNLNKPGDVSRSASLNRFSLNDTTGTTSSGGGDSGAAIDPGASILTSEPTVGLSQPATPKRTKTLRKPPPAENMQFQPNDSTTDLETSKQLNENV